MRRTAQDTIVFDPARVGYADEQPRYEGDWGWETVVFADGEMEESFEVTATLGQREYSERDLALGMDGYSIASNTIAGAVYLDPIQQWSVADDGVVTFVLSDHAAATFQGRTWIYHCDPDELRPWREAVERIIGKAPVALQLA